MLHDLASTALSHLAVFRAWLFLAEIDFSIDFTYYLLLTASKAAAEVKAIRSDGKEIATKFCYIITVLPGVEVDESRGFDPRQRTSHVLP